MMAAPHTWATCTLVMGLSLGLVPMTFRSPSRRENKPASGGQTPASTPRKSVLSAGERSLSSSAAFTLS
jgi:hypothetical protein